jgi:hypothetical protein
MNTERTAVEDNKDDLLPFSRFVAVIPIVAIYHHEDWLLELR